MRIWLERTNGAAAIVRADVARAPLELQHGLMGVTQLAEDGGMLFAFDADEDHTLWMQHVPIPLDMIFIRESGFGQLEVIGVVRDATPMSTYPRSVGARSRYVLEVNGGWCARYGVDVGARVRFE